ncbi:hypothetical protein KXD93_05955 [Mucilaginibacter sp. BJC16-A38]|uniref:hypothetical protein n=1 Tax=Mucilaginibacter phenanthrenivorans TaxID=1234842 RepID=UPI002157C137|nr:hypothetical protein [Mucilaginibacter phenanthrenivorans]MCR8557175.1 hypothetical protein [Mucilaginibacter phenanthrenivorans]
MQNRLLKFTALLLFIFCGYFASAKNILHNSEPGNAKKLSFFNESLQKNPDWPCNYECIINSVPVQIVNVQQLRSAHFSQLINTSQNTSTIAVRHLNFICGRGSSELSRFRKLILFPFHAFW